MLFFVTNLLPNILFQLSAHEFVMLVFLALPYCPNSPFTSFGALLIGTVTFIVAVQLAYDRWRTQGDRTLFQNCLLRYARFAFRNLTLSIGRGVFLRETGVPFCRISHAGQGSDLRIHLSGLPCIVNVLRPGDRCSLMGLRDIVLRIQEFCGLRRRRCFICMAEFLR